MRKMLSRLAVIGAASVTLALALLAAPAYADDNFPLDRAPDNADNFASLQHGAKLFVNYCLNCHSANLMRYSALTSLGISPQEIQTNLLFTTDKIGNTMSVAMKPDDAKAWFGTAPPDLSVEARARGRDWIYTYLRSFYRDDTRPTGWNNLVYENVSMPNVLWELQGQRTAKFDDVIDERSGKQSINSSATSRSRRGRCPRWIMIRMWPTLCRTCPGCPNRRSKPATGLVCGCCCSSAS